MSHRVGITGLGFCTSIGTGIKAVTDSLINLRSGIRRVNLVPGIEVPVKVAGVVDGFDVGSTNPLAWTFPDGIEFDRTLLRSIPPHGVYALVAVREALDNAGLSDAEIRDGDTGLHTASSGSAMMTHHHLARLEETDWQRANPNGIVSSIAGTLNFNLAAHLGIRGNNCGFVSACASGSHALGHAFDEIVLGRQKRMIVVAGEDCNAHSVLPFDGMRALSTDSDPAKASRPFDVGRNGFVAAGGSVAMILEADPSTEPVAWLGGWGQAADGHSIAAPHPEGEGLTRAMNRAIHSAGLCSQNVDYVNAHATSTIAGDKAEALALQNVFGNTDPGPQISSTKGLSGHGLSLSGLLEAAICALAINQSIIPGNANLTNPDPATTGLRLPTKTSSAAVRVALNNSSGFGGSNVCHVLSSPATD